MKKKYFFKTARFYIAFLLTLSWTFAGWPQVTFFGVSLPPGVPRAHAAVVKSVQSGTTTSTATGTVTVNITSVDTTKAFLIFNTRSSIARPVTAIKGRIASATTLEFNRLTNEASVTPFTVDTVNIQWYVVEYSSGVSVQRGIISSQSSVPMDATITAVASTSQAFVTWSRTVRSADNGFSTDDPLYCQLTSTTNVRCSPGATNTDAGFKTWYQVIEFTNANDITVQTGTTSFGTGDTSVDQTISSVTTSRTFIMAGSSTSSAGTTAAKTCSRIFRAQLIDSTTARFDRGCTNNEAITVGWQIVELKDGTSVQHGTEDFPIGDGQEAVTSITAVDTNNAIAFSGFSHGGGAQNGGKSTYSSDDIQGDQEFTFNLASSTQLTIDRNSTLGAADVGWFVVEFKPDIEQAAYRFYANADSADVGSALADNSTAASLSATGDAFRLRMALHVGDTQLSASAINFKLQFATKSGTCDTGFSGESYADVTTSTAISYKNNASVADGDNLTDNANDPTHSSDTIVNQDYEEANNFTNSVAAVPAGQDGLWDFALYDNGATASTDYCFKVVKSDGTALDTYSVVPQITTAAASSPTFEQSGFRFFANADTADVGSALAGNNTAATLTATGGAFRLRALIHVGTAQLGASGATFKLQFAQQSGTCDTAFSGESYADVTTSTVIAYKNNASVADGDNLTDNASDPTHSTDTIVNQDYEEANNFTNSVAAIPSGQDGLWDFALFDNGASAGTAYCFRMLESDGTVLDTYSVVPQITTLTPSLTFSISDSAIGFGTLSSSAARYATGDAAGSGSETEAHTLSAATNAASGYVITVQGATLTSGDYTITAIGGSNTASAAGTEQFGLRLVASGTGTVTAPYAASGFAYAASASASDEVASGAGDGTTTTFSVRYIANILGATEPGTYSATLTYVTTGTF